MVAPQGANGVHLPDPVSCKTPDRDNDSKLPIHKGLFKRTIRPIALSRKNALFAGHEAGAQNWAMLASIIETCKLNKVELHGYLTGVLEAIVNGHKQSQAEDLLPWNYGK